MLIGAVSRSLVYAQKTEDKFKKIERSGLIYTAETAEPNYDVLLRNYPRFTKDELENLFTTFCQIDTTNDYSLSPDEISACLKKIGRPMPKRLVSEQIRKFDAQQSGTLEFEEFVNFLSKQSGPGAITSQHASKMCSVM